MSWENELYSVYETQYGKETDDGIALMPVSHSVKDARIEVTIDAQGEFVTARGLSKEEGQNTLIPVTEDSASRGNGVNPMPFADWLRYTAGDLSEFSDDKSKFFLAYSDGLQAWHESAYTHPAVDALYKYIIKKSMIKDLIACGVLKVNSETGKLEMSEKITGDVLEKSLVRFRINGIDEPQTWKSKTLSDAFIAWNASQMTDTQLCYATGKVRPVLAKHPANITETQQLAKLISVNRVSEYTYLGRFRSADEALALSYDFSQKMHNALKWLIQRQKIVFGSMTMIVWASTLEQLPDIQSAGISDEVIFEEDEPIISTQKIYCDLLRKYILGISSKMPINTKVMLMCVDAATTGRLSVSLYTELEGSKFMENLIKWHEDTAAVRWYSKQKKRAINSFSVKKIINCAFGNEMTKGLECKNETLKDNVLRLIPCITQGRPLPKDIVNALYRKASNPLAYDKSYNHRNVVETACGMIRKQNIDRKEGITAMAYDPTITDRSYLYGCLLAVADAAERDSHDSDGDRVTNARRYWSAFSGRPYRTWRIIEERLRPYLDKLGKKSVRYEKMMNELMDKMGIEQFSDNTALSPAYLLGYHHYLNKIYTKKVEE